MTRPVEMPLWLLLLLLAFAAVTFASHFLFPSVRWFFRRRLERAVDRLNERLTRPIEPFKLARRHDMIQRLVYDPQVTEAVVGYAERRGVREDVAFEKARRYAREIVPSFSAFTYFSFGTRAADWLGRMLYDVRTGPDNEAVLAGIDKDATVIFIMNHRSNMDYVLVTTLAAKASALSYAVGEWARVWPLSRLIKSMGAYFIRRRSRGELYRAVLARYVQMATTNGVTQAIFPEGGLSLDGRLRPPKLGLLSYVVDGHDPAGRDVVFVPVAINYDRVLEDRVLVAAAARGDRRFGARMTVILRFILSMLWRRMRGKFRRFGVAEVIFGAPVSLKEFGTPTDLDALAHDLMHRIEDEMPLLFVPLTARVLLGAETPLDEATLKARVEAEIAAADAPPPPEPKDGLDAALAEARRILAERDLIRETPGGWTAAAGAGPLLTFYANSIAHFFEDRDAASAK
ncbi:1-acyl-sn-glycerol-3-phosphate acyltransferase [Roseovarius sp. SCSIO 43702]|uniref:1-acyl-sn-glycerol-3-phosphate acyltransferase n=1 Tax=Roseovarius sp. SCSIO 43702 TaxID=2823043 RepID=UPI001C73C5AC|nr:1-acyl-sn-glycerol-3-phosphate acyltransferase [Roseovarius sp. SCSIO 43702]QYX57623.1 1-acyl-sn-glycerol-3-phosphate acyltransferase [Roseovarius sp. SCSIO 43702]